MSVYMLEDGDLLRTVNLGINFDHDGNGVAGKIERLSWDSQMEWEWFYPGETNRSHHDIEPLSNGNFLMIAWDFKSEAEAQQAGRNPNKMSQDTLWPDKIVEVQPVGTDQANIVWEWNIWDHLIQEYDFTKDNYGVVGDHPELLDINFVDSPDTLNPYKSDWMHCNGIDYNPFLDQIALSCKNMNEIYIIDHSTTTAQAASHSGGNSGKGGDILYRWGNPEAYRAGTPDDQQLFGQHDIQWINEGRLGAGDLIVFNNGVGRDTSYSSADVISPPLVNGEYVLQSGSSWAPVVPSWSWNQGTSMYATSLGGVERLENGNTLVTWGVRGTFIEVNPEGEVVWKYINPVVNTGPLNQGDDIPQSQNANSYKNKVFKTHRYNSSFPAFVGKDMTPGDYVESWIDNCSNEESIPWDKDGDGCIDDSDADGVKDNVDLCNGFDDNIDIDGDSIPDDCDALIDSDGDGISDMMDICVGFDDSIDVDADGIPDGCDELVDSDADGISDADDACPDYDDSIDVDADGIADGCDSLIDSDGDGISDADDTCPDYDDSIDVDADGIADGCDSLIDSDADGVADSSDACQGYDDSIDIDQDGIADGCDSLIDSDADGISDGDDQCAGYNDLLDQDGDGIPDHCDQTPMPEDDQTNVTDTTPVDDGENTLTGAGFSINTTTTIIIGLASIIVVLSIILFTRRRRGSPPQWDHL
jgi:hypothetical protein